MRLQSAARNVTRSETTPHFSQAFCGGGSRPVDCVALGRIIGHGGKSARIAGEPARIAIGNATEDFVCFLQGIMTYCALELRLYGSYNFLSDGGNDRLSHGSFAGAGQSPIFWQFIYGGS